MKKFLLTAVLMLAAMLVATGCNRGGGSDTPEAGARGALPSPDHPVTFSFFADVTWLEFDSLDGIIPDEVTRLTGISFDFTKATDNEQLVLMMSAGDLPDLVMTGSAVRQSMLSDPQFSFSYNELIERYAPDWEIPEVEQKLNAYFSQDGYFYMLRNIFNTVEEIQAFDRIGPNFGQLHFRQDIHQALGSPEVVDKDSLFALLTMVQQEFPDMTPLVYNPRETRGFGQFVGFDPLFPRDEFGNRSHRISDPTFRDFARMFFEMHQLGFFTTENVTYTSDEQVFQGIITGDTFMVSHFAGNDDQRFTGYVRTTNPEASFVQMPLTPAWNQTIGVSGWAGLFITRSNHDPEAAINLVRWAKEPHNQIITMLGVEGYDWEHAADGTFVTLPRYNAAVEAGRLGADYRQLAFLLSATDYIREGIMFYAVATPDTQSVFRDAVSRANWSNSINLAVPMAGTDEQIMITNLNALDVEFFARLITAPDLATFEQIFDEMLDEAYAIGITQVNETLTRLYGEVNELLGVN